jgi:hypothetical protein
MSVPRLTEVRISAPDVEAALDAWHSILGLAEAAEMVDQELVFQVAGCRLRLALVQPGHIAGLAGIQLSVPDLDVTVDALGESIEAGSTRVEPRFSHGVPIELVKA